MSAAGSPPRGGSGGASPGHSGEAGARTPDTSGYASASKRRYLRGNLPAVYSEIPRNTAVGYGQGLRRNRAPGAREDSIEETDATQPPVMGLLGGLEQVLDPIVTLLDNLAAHLDPHTAPRHVIDFLLAIVGAPIDDTLPFRARQALAARAGDIARMRGTRRGLQATLDCALPELTLTVVDNGRATWGADEADGAPAPVSFEVRAPNPLTRTSRAQIERCVADHVPVGATYAVVVASGGALDE